MFLLILLLFGSLAGIFGQEEGSKEVVMTCEDKAAYITQCPDWAKRGYCETNKAWMKENCCKSCSSIDPKKCEDAAAYKTQCPDWAKRGYCKSNEAWMRINCCKSCHFDHHSTTTTASPPHPTQPHPTPHCVDDDEYKGQCGKWAEEGECEKNEAWMKQHCCKTCKPDLRKFHGKIEDHKGGGGKGKDACLKDANMYRSKHYNTPALQWDPVLAARAQAYAEKLKALTLRTGSVQIIHDPDNWRLKMGENLWYWPYKEVGDMAMYCRNADKLWYSEIKNWSFSSSRPIGGVTGHFTQMVWKETTRVGYGVVTLPTPGWPGYTTGIVVAKYQVPGNDLRHARENVQPLK